ncbi:MAG: phosphoglucomutase/phosphomannomutase family protein [Pseudomonadota bacterium]
MSEIKFGTDGWRAIVDKDFIPENIKKVIQAFADYYPELPEAGRPVAVGYDRRNKSKESADLIASVLLANNIPTILSNNFCPTPTVSWLVKNKKCAAGIMVTASHNPAQWNGIKFKESYGGAASEKYVHLIEDYIAKNEVQRKVPKTVEIKNHPKLEMFDPYGEYLSVFASMVDLDLIKKKKYKIVIDPLYGAGTGFFTRLFGDMVEEIHTKADITFGGLHPEPIPPNTNELVDKVEKGKYTAGLLMDGDADRAGAVDETGKFVTTHEIFSLLIKHLVEDKKWKGKIIKSISTTMMIDRLGKKYGLPVDTVPVGFKYISPAMKEPGVLIGGEESGGFGLPRHIPERDGIFSDLLLLELMATTGKKLSELVADLQKDVGPTFYKRVDNHLSQEQIQKVRERMKDLNIKAIGERKVTKHTTIDGHHFLFDDESWLLFRASGTEPLIRVYAEAPTMEQVEAFLKEGMKAVGL